MNAQLLRAAILHTPRNPFSSDFANALETFEDGALLVDENGRIAATGDYATIRAAHPDTLVTDLRGGYLLPGFVDTHIHFPQVRVIGGLGEDLLTWLDRFALPEESRMADVAYAQDTARLFCRALIAHGTTTALVFGAHFAPATAALFEEAAGAGLRIITGMVLSDRNLRAELHQSPTAAHGDATTLIRRFHGQSRLAYAVTPRFALSTSEAMLEVCQSLTAEHQGLYVQTHINENPLEVKSVARHFPWAPDYLSVYERFGLIGRYSVLAHNVHATIHELARLSAAQAAIAHCPSSNAALGSGIFPLRRHLDAGIRCALGTDVGGGTGFGILKEALQAYMMQRLLNQDESLRLTPAQLLYLATKAGAEALHIEQETGDFTPGKSADFVYIRPEPGSALAAIAATADSMERILAALITLGDAQCIRETRIAGKALNAA